MPNSFWNLTELETLRITDNNLTRIPDSIGNLQNLDELYECNRTCAAMSHLTKGVGRRLDNTQPTAVPHAIGTLVKLRILSLGSNRLTALPALGDLTELGALIASSNLLNQLPESFRHLARLSLL